VDEKREKSIFRLLPPNSNFAWFLVTFALNSFNTGLVIGHMETKEHFIRKLIYWRNKNIDKRAYNLAACITISFLVEFL